jgi:hypothetical protein
MWLTAFSGLVSLVGWLSGLAGWFHDRGQRQQGELNAVARDQNIALQVMRNALATSRTVTKDQLDQKLKDGKL